MSGRACLPARQSTNVVLLYVLHLHVLMSNRVIIYFDLQKGEINNCIEIHH